MSMHKCVHVHACVCLCVCTCVHAKTADNLRCHSASTIHLSLRQGLSLTKNFPSRLDWLAREPKGLPVFKYKRKFHLRLKD